MEFPEKYSTLVNNSFSKGEYSIVPIRFKDRNDIMQWRNEQIYHLRQSEFLRQENQDKYFNETVSLLFDKDQPNQLLFSYLINEECIGYGGLVHINWIDKNAEISFIMKTELEQKEFKKHWSIYLKLIEQVSFNELGLHKIFTYAFDLRPKLYLALEDNGFKKEAVLKEHCLFDGRFLDVIIHSKMKNDLLMLRRIDSTDKEITFQWANDPLTRKNSFSSEPIEFTDHSIWFDNKLNDKDSYYLIAEWDTEKAGLIRFDYDLSKKAYIIGIAIDEKFRGKRLSSLLLKEACKYLLERMSVTIVAYIKASNIPSIKAFERAGFKLDESEDTEENHTLIFVYEN